MENIKYDRKLLKTMLIIYLEEKLLKKESGGFSFIDSDKAKYIAETILVGYEIVVKCDK